MSARTHTIDSAILRLAKERNEARELVNRIMATQHLGDDSQEKYNALCDAWRAVMQWKWGGGRDV
jgi:hypothetical protein